MAGFDEIGTGLFVIVLMINFFLAGFGGLPIDRGFHSFVPDENVTENTVKNTGFNIGSVGYSVPTQTQFNNQNDPFGAIVNSISQVGFPALQTILFGITQFAIRLGAPQAFLIAIILPLNIIFLLYLVAYIVSGARSLAGLVGL